MVICNIFLMEVYTIWFQLRENIPFIVINVIILLECIFSFLKIIITCKMLCRINLNPIFLKG